nr:integrase [Oceanobacillus damuensis]
MLLSDAVKYYEADKRIEGFSSQTLKAYKLQAKLLINFFSNIPISQISTYDLQHYLANQVKILNLQVYLTEYDLLNLYFVGLTKKVF